MDRKTKPEDISAWEAGIVYPDGRGAVVLTPLDGVPYVEAEAIGRTYQETAHAEGGHIEVHSLRGYPTAGFIATLLGTAEANLERRTGRKFTLTLFGGVLRSVRDDGFHAAAHIPPTASHSARSTCTPCSARTPRKARRTPSSSSPSPTRWSTR